MRRSPARRPVLLVGVASRRDRHPVLQLLRHVDFVLVLAPILLSIVGALMVYSATRSGSSDPHYFLDRQVVYDVLGIVVMVVVAAIPYKRLETWGYVLYGLVVLALLGVFVVGVNGAAVDGSSVRWYSFGPIQLQPSEFGVLAVFVAMAIFLSRNQDGLDVRRTAIVLALAILPMLLVFKQPDLGTTLVMGVVVATMLVVGGLRARYLALLAVLLVVGVIGAVHLGLLKHYQIERLTAFINQSQNTQSINYNLTQSKIAIGAGGFWGQGLFHGVETNLGSIPVQYSDFIFSAVGEQLGFVGGAVVLGLFALIAARIIRAIQIAKDPFGRLLCAGALAFIVFSVFQNVGMTIGIMPITGIPLPFISYGGSALFSFFAAIGLVLNVEMRRYTRRSPA